MPRYFFDTRDNDAFIEDDVGVDYPDLDAVKAAVETSLAELAHNVVAGTLKRELAVEVRDEFGPVLKAGMSFEAIALRPAYTELNVRFGSRTDTATSQGSQLRSLLFPWRAVKSANGSRASVLRWPSRRR